MIYRVMVLIVTLLAGILLTIPVNGQMHDSNGSKSSPASDAHTIGSADEIWQKVESRGPELYVRTNGAYPSGDSFDTYIVSNLPESYIVGAPQSEMVEVEGNCETHTFHLMGSISFAGKDRSGVVMGSTPPETIVRKVVPHSPFEKAFSMLCQIARSKYADTKGSSSGTFIARPSPVNAVSSNFCASVSYKNPNYHKSMGALAKKAHLPDNYYTRYHEDLVKALCQGDLESVNSLIDNGDVAADEVTRLKQALMDGTVPKAKGSAQKRSDDGKSYGYSKKKFLDMNLCMACADNVAQWYVQRPTSRCGMLAKHALEGDPEAVKELQAFPSYCAWPYVERFK